MNDDELSALVAEKVMGWKRVTHPGGKACVMQIHNYASAVLPTPGETWECWHNADDSLNSSKPGDYSNEIFHAWQVVERMQADGWQLRLYTRSDWSDAVFSIEANPLAREPGRSGHGVGKNVPTAICLAALSALRVNVTPSS